MTDDAELLRQYAQAGSEDAFAELVQRYLPVVFASALRQTGGDAELAKDVCQTVFIDLGRKARSLLGHELLVAWLFTATRFAAASMVRENRRRQARESVAVSMREDNTEPAEESWNSQLAPVLDTALAELSSEDRNAILLRFFQGKPLKEVGALLGINEDAARMRVTRAVDKLHHLLKTRGVAVPAAALGGLLAAEAVIAPPAGLAAVISTVALAGTPLATAATATATKAIAMTTLQKSIIGATIAVAITGGIYETRRASHLLTQVQTLQQQQAVENQDLRERSSQVEALRQENQHLIEQLRAEAERPRTDQQELLRLRGQVSLLQRAAGENPRLQAEVDKLAQDLKQAEAQRLEQLLPKDPELRLLTRKTMLARVWGNAMLGFAKRNEGQLPDTLAAAAPYIVDEQMVTQATTNGISINDFELVYHGSLKGIEDPSKIILMREKQPFHEATGRWARVYVYGNGETSALSSDSEDFTAAEQWKDFR